MMFLRPQMSDLDDFSTYVKVVECAESIKTILTHLKGQEHLQNRLKYFEI